MAVKLSTVDKSWDLGVHYNPNTGDSRVYYMGGVYTHEKRSANCWRGVRATRAHSTGKRYFEVVPSVGWRFFIGLTTKDVPTIAQSTQSPGINCVGTYLAYSEGAANSVMEGVVVNMSTPAFNAACTVGVKVDFDAKKMYFKVNNGVDTPAAGIPIKGGLFYPTCFTYGDMGNYYFTYKFKASGMSYLPAGYEPWDNGVENICLFRAPNNHVYTFKNEQSGAYNMVDLGIISPSTADFSIGIREDDVDMSKIIEYFKNMGMNSLDILSCTANTGVVSSAIPMNSATLGSGKDYSYTIDTTNYISLDKVVLA